MLVANRTVPQYHPVSRLTPEQLENWFTSPVNGLGVSAEAMEAFKDEITDPSDLLGLNDSTDVEAIQRSLSTRAYDAQGAIKLVNYLSMVRRDIFWEQLQWTNLVNFVYDWNALVVITKKTAGEPPVWKRGHQPQTVSFLYSVIDYLNTVYGEHNCPLGYLIDEDAVRDNTSAEDAPPLSQGRYVSDKHSSLTAELRARAPHNMAVAQADNTSLFAILTKCFQLSPFAAQTQPFEKTHDGMCFWKHLKTTNATDSHHEAVAKTAIEFCRTAKWDGTGDLIDHIAKLRWQFSIYLEAKKHVTLQDYDDRTHVGWFLENMTCSDVNAGTYLTQIKHSKEYRDNWEAAMSYMSQCPYKGKNNGRRKRGGGGENTADFAVAEGLTSVPNWFTDLFRQAPIA